MQLRKRKFYIGTGIAILVFLAISYFIKVTTDNGGNYSEFTSLLGLIIFYNPFILLLYILIAIFLIGKGTIFSNINEMKGGKKK